MLMLRVRFARVFTLPAQKVEVDEDVRWACLGEFPRVSVVTDFDRLLGGELGDPVVVLVVCWVIGVDDDSVFGVDPVDPDPPFPGVTLMISSLFFLPFCVILNINVFHSFFAFFLF